MLFFCLQKYVIPNDCQREKVKILSDIVLNKPICFAFGQCPVIANPYNPFLLSFTSSIFTSET